jgi:glucose-6-phosphate 1-epimerase
MQTLEKLEKFAQAGRVAFREDDVAPVAILVAPGGAAEVSFYGANVISWRPTGQPPALWLADSYRVVNPGSPTRGGIPVCWPWFGRLDDQSKPMHGCVRTEIWSLIGTEVDAETTSATFALEETPSTLALWPHRFHLELKVTVGKTLSLELTTENTGDATFAITEALHTYFRIGEISKTLVAGFDCQPYFDKVTGKADCFQSGAIAFTGATDRVYHHHAGAAVINDEATGRRILISKEGSAASVVWNPWAEKCALLKDMSPDDWHRFVCVETANAGGDPIEVAPGERHTISATYTAALGSAEQA